MARKSAEESAVMGKEGERVRQRRERLGMTKVELHQASGVDRATIGAIEGGKGFRMESLAKIERALESAELEAGLATPAAEPSGDAGLVTFEIQMPGGASVTVRGPVGDSGKLAESVRKMLREAWD